MVRNDRSRRRSEEPRQDRTVVWVISGTIAGFLVLAGLFAWSRQGIREAPRVETATDRALDRAVDELLSGADEDEELALANAASKRARRRRSAARKARAQAVPPNDAIEKSAKRKTKRPNEEASTKTTAETKSVAKKEPAAIGVATSRGTPETHSANTPGEFRLTEAERIALAREVSGDGPSATIPTTPTAGIAGRRPPATTTTPSSAGGGQAAADELFTLMLMGSLGGAPIPRDDAQTWARLAYFFQIQAARPFYLVQPDGNIATVRPKGYDGALPSVPVATEAPGFRLVLRASASQRRGLTFYGKQVASNYVCTIQCSIEQRRGDEYHAIDQLTVSEEFTPARKVASNEMMRTAYDMALQKLTAGLLRRELFQASQIPHRSRTGTVTGP